MLSNVDGTEIKAGSVLTFQSWSTTKGNLVKALRKTDLDEAFADGLVSDLTVIGTAPKAWHIELTLRRPNGQKEYCVYVVRRPDEKTGERKIRVWADLRLLIKWLSKEYGVKQGDFQISENFKGHE